MKKILTRILLAAALLATARGQVMYVANLASGTIGEYTTSGATINASFISGLNQPFGIAVSGNDMFISEQGNNSIAEYTTSGALVNPALITGLSLPAGIAISGNDLYVANSAGPTSTTAVGEYTLSGATVNPSLISGFENPVGVATDGSYLYVSAFSGGTVGKYTLSGATVNASLVSGLQNPGGLALDGHGNLYVSSYSQVGLYTTSGGIINSSLISGGYNTGLGIALDGHGNLFWADNYGGAGGNIVGEYNTSGQPENVPLISGLQNPVGLVVVPEPTSCQMLFMAFSLCLIVSAKANNKKAVSRVRLKVGVIFPNVRFHLPLRHEVGDLSRLGSGERNAAKPQARQGRASGSERVIGPG